MTIYVLWVFAVMVGLLLLISYEDDDDDLNYY